MNIEQKTDFDFSMLSDSGTPKPSKASKPPAVASMRAAAKDKEIDAVLRSVDIEQLVHTAAQREQEQQQQEPKATRKRQSVQIQAPLHEHDAVGYKIAREKRIIRLYLKNKRFAPLLKKEPYARTNLDRLSLSELEQIHEDIKIIVANKSSGEFYENLIFGVIGSGEAMLSKHYNVSGLTLMLRKNEPFLDALNEFMIENQLPHTRAEIRILMLTVQQAIMMHGLNSFSNSIKEELNFEKIAKEKNDSANVPELVPDGDRARK